MEDLASHDGLIVSNSLKSLSPIYFVKIRLSNFLGNEFLVKMHKL